MRHIPIATLRAMTAPFHFIEQRTLPSVAAVRAGIYQPLVTGKLSGETVLLWGEETLEVAAEASVETVACLELGEVTPIEAARAVLMAENRPGSWAVRELVPLLESVDRYALGELQELVDGSKRGLLDQARRAAALDEPVRDMVLSEVITLRHGEELAELPEALLESVRQAMGRGSFSVRREIVQMSVEIYKGHVETDPRIAERVQDALAAKEPRQALYELRYPSYSDASKELNRFRSSLLKGTGISLREPPNLEGDAFAFIIPFSSREELQKRLQMAQRAAGEVDRITELLG